MRLRRVALKAIVLGQRLTENLHEPRAVLVLGLVFRKPEKLAEIAQAAWEGVFVGHNHRIDDVFRGYGAEAACGENNPVEIHAIVHDDVVAGLKALFPSGLQIVGHRRARGDVPNLRGSIINGVAPEQDFSRFGVLVRAVLDVRSAEGFEVGVEKHERSPKENWRTHRGGRSSCMSAETHASFGIRQQGAVMTPLPKTDGLGISVETFAPAVLNRAFSPSPPYFRKTGRGEKVLLRIEETAYAKRGLSPESSSSPRSSKSSALAFGAPPKGSSDLTN